MRTVVAGHQSAWKQMTFGRKLERLAKTRVFVQASKWRQLEVRRASLCARRQRPRDLRCASPDLVQEFTKSCFTFCSRQFLVLCSGLREFIKQVINVRSPDKSHTFKRREALVWLVGPPTERDPNARPPLVATSLKGGGVKLGSVAESCQVCRWSRKWPLQSRDCSRLCSKFKAQVLRIITQLLNRFPPMTS